MFVGFVTFTRLTRASGLSFRWKVEIAYSATVRHDPMST